MRIGAQSAQINLRSQFFAVFFRHIFVSALAAIFGIGAFWWFLTQRVSNIVYSCIFTCIYFGMMYSKCNKQAVHDLKGYAQTKAYPAKGAVLALPVLAVTLVLDIVRFLMWKYFSDDAGLNSVPAVICNTVFILWNFAFNGIMAIQKSHISLPGHILIYTMPLLSASCGYFAGYKRFCISEKLMPFMYEKSDEDDSGI